MRTFVLYGSGLVVGVSGAVDAIQRLSPTERLVVLGSAALAVTSLLYLLGCAIWPYANCSRCAGSGKSRSLTGKKFRNCPRCKGTGRRRRFGRALLDRRTDRRNRR